MNIVVAVLLSDFMGALGMSIAFLSAHIVVCLTQTLSVKGELPLKRFVAEGAPFLVSGALMLIAVRLISFFLGGSIASLVFEIAVGALLYIAFCLMIPRLFKNETAERLSCIFFRTLRRGQGKGSNEK